MSRGSEIENPRLEVLTEGGIAKINSMQYSPTLSQLPRCHAPIQDHTFIQVVTKETNMTSLSNRIVT